MDDASPSSSIRTFGLLGDSSHQINPELREAHKAASTIQRAFRKKGKDVSVSAGKEMQLDNTWRGQLTKGKHRRNQGIGFSELQFQDECAC